MPGSDDDCQHRTRALMRDALPLRKWFSGLHIGIEGEILHEVIVVFS